MFSVSNLHASVDDKKILKGIEIDVKPGEVHAIMGPNGSGKSTLANLVAGKYGYTLNEGSITFNGQDISDLEPEERACLGIFLAFQYPVAISGVNNMVFLQAALNSVRKARGELPLDAMDAIAFIKERMKLVEMKSDLLQRSLNTGFSGGEKKRNEILQMLVLEPKLAILDETDSGLDIDALKTVSDGVNHMRSPNRSFIIVTHYQRLLDHIKPDFVHVLKDGKIIKSGNYELALKLEKEGYGWLDQ
ncbi:MAG: Fe-S cluster assembly ATPase SufC [Gammaproteobacteria bacterium]|nr:Fe-S cluster assembly ATPase SufC [Gammaproteobacteria bacterium]